MSVIVESVKAPILESLEQDKVRQFLKVRELYERQVNNMLSVQPETRMKPIEETLGQGLLKMLAMTYGGNCDWRLLGGDNLVQILRTIAGVDDLDQNTASVREMLKSLAAMPKKVRFAKDRVNNQFQSMFQYLHDTGIDKEFFGENGEWLEGPAQVFTEAMVKGCWPERFRSEVRDRIAFNNELRKRPDLLFLKMKDIAIEFDRWGKNPEVEEAGSKRQRESGSFRKQKKRKGNNYKTPKPIPTTKPWCSHCKKPGHYEKDCWNKDISKMPPKLKEKLEKRGQLGQENRSNKNFKLRMVRKERKPDEDLAQKSLALDLESLEHLDITSVDEDGDAFLKALDSVYSPISCKFLLDPGATVTTINTNLLEALIKAFPDKKVNEPMANPIPLVVADERQVVVKNKTCPLNIGIKTVYGTVYLRNIRCAIMPTKGKGKLLTLGRKTCQRLGIDVTKSLEETATKRNNQGRASQKSIMLSVESMRNNLLNKLDSNTENEQAYISDKEDVDLFGSDLSVSNALKAAISKAKAEGLSESEKDDITNVLKKHLDVFRTKLGDDPPAKVEEMRAVIKTDAKPVKARVRRYSEEARQWLSSFVKELETKGLIYKNPQATWASAAMPRPKPNGRGYRMVIDLRAINNCVELSPYPLPHLERISQMLKGYPCFATIDLCKGYWQYPLAEECQEYFTFVTEDGLFTPTRVPQGSINGTTHFQAQTEKVLEGLVNTKCLVYVDDILIFGKTKQDLFTNMDQVLDRLNTRGIKVAADKLDIYKKEVKWCGKLIDGNGVRHDPYRIKGLNDVKEPQNAGDLMSFLCALNWMRMHIPDLAKLQQPLRSKLEVLLKGKKRTKARAFKIPIVFNYDERKAWQAIKHALKHTVALAHPDPKQHTCVFTDASEHHYGVMITQVPQKDYDSDKHVADMCHQPLAFLSGQFKASQLNWSVTDKEGYAILAAYLRFDYLLHGQVTIFTDHRSLAYIFNSHKDIRDISKATSHRLERWSNILGRHAYNIVHICGTDNVWADLLSRIRTPTIARKQFAIYQYAAERPTSDSLTTDGMNIDWAALPALQATCSKPSGVTLRDGVYYHGDNLWLPTEELQLRALIHAHTGISGHRGLDATIQNLRGVFWPTMTDDAKKFIGDCLACVDSRCGSKIPRPYAGTIHGNKPNHVVHMDFLYIEIEKTGQLKYILVLVDDFTQVTMLAPCVSPTSDIAAETLLRWMSIYGPPQILVSDTGSHFKNEMMNTLSEHCGFKQRFAIAYSPWTNGTVERCVQEVVKTLKAILNERKEPTNTWPKYVPLVQACLNMAYRERLKRTPLEIMLGRKVQASSMSILVRMSKNAEEELRRVDLADIDKYCSKLMKALDDIHKDVSSRRDQQRAAERKRSSKGRMPNFDVGDFVLIARVKKPGKDRKLMAVWHGPYRITKVISDHLYVVQNLLTGGCMKSHSARMQFYKDSSLRITEELKNTMHYQGTFGVECIDGLKKVKDGYEVHVKWEGFEDVEKTWEPLETILEDQPEFLCTELAKLKLSAKIRKELKILYRIDV